MADTQHAETNHSEDEREPFGAFITDQETRQVVTALAKRRGWPDNSLQRGGLAGALRTLGVMAPPRLLVVDVAGSGQDEALEGVAEIARSGAIVIAIGGSDDEQIFRYMLASGAADYLGKPIDAQSLDRAVMRAEALVEGDSGKRRLGRCVAVVGARGGVGASTVAGNLAWMLSERFNRRVMLIDLDLQFGTTSFAFDLQPVHGLRESVEDPDRIDEVFLDRASQQLGDRLRVLADEEAVDQPPDVKPGAYRALIESLRESYDVVVLDLPRRLLAQQADIAAYLTNAVIVSNQSLTGLRDTNRLTRTLKSYNPDLRVLIATNSAHRNASDELNASDFAKQLQEKLAIRLPFDARATVRAIRGGRPIGEAAPRSKLLKALEELGTRLVGAAPEKRRSWFTRLIGR